MSVYVKEYFPAGNTWTGIVDCIKSALLECSAISDITDTGTGTSRELKCKVFGLRYIKVKYNNSSTGAVVFRNSGDTANANTFNIISNYSTAGFKLIVADTPDILAITFFNPVASQYTQTLLIIRDGVSSIIYGLFANTKTFDTYASGIVTSVDNMTAYAPLASLYGDDGDYGIFANYVPRGTSDERGKSIVCPVYLYSYDSSRFIALNPQNCVAFINTQYNYGTILTRGKLKYLYTGSLLIGGDE